MADEELTPEPGVLEAVNRGRASRGEEPLDKLPSIKEKMSPEDVALIDEIADAVFKPPQR